MSLLASVVESAPGQYYFAKTGTGGGGGGSTLQSPASITPASVGTCSLLVQSIDSTAATLTVTTAGGGADTGSATLTLTGGNATNLNVTSHGAGPASVNVLGGTASNALIDVLADAGQSAIVTLQSGAVSNQTTIQQLGNSLSISTPLVTGAVIIDSATNNVSITGLNLVDGDVAGAITGQNILGPSATALNSGAPVTRTSYALPAPSAGPNNIGWWCYTTGTTQTTGSPSSVQSCLSVMAYWNGTAFSYGGNMFNFINAGGGGVAAATFAQLFLSVDRTTVVFYCDIGVAGNLADMYWAATQMTGAQPGL